MKHYILLSLITGSGGVQCYVASKAKYLESIGWYVTVISNNEPNTKEKCLIDSLNKYLPNGNPYVGIHPCYLPHHLVNKAMRRFLEVIGPVKEEDETIVESWDSPSALWGELIASRIHGRHIFWTANEQFRKYGEPVNMCYEEKIDFYKFKMDRGEIFTTVKAANRLFEGYWTYKEGDFIESNMTEDPIQDIYCSSINNIEKKDWNIGYIGRSIKPYVPNIYDGVKKFAIAHPDKDIQFIIVGSVTSNREFLEGIKEVPNLTITELGDLYPLPRSLYSKVDVIIAGSGSARHSADEGVLVITADSLELNSHGLLGYDTNESIHKDDETDGPILSIQFDEALERALVVKTWQNQSCKWKKTLGVAECTQLQFDIIRNADPILQYYDMNKLLDGRTDYLFLLKRFLLKLIIRLRIV